MKSHIHPFLQYIVAQSNVHLHPRRIRKRPYQTFLRSEVHVRRLRIRIVCQGASCVYRMSCVHSVWLSSCLLFWVCFSTHPRGSTVHTCLCVLFVWVTHDGCSLIDVASQATSSQVSLFIVVLVWHLLLPSLAFFFLEKKNMERKYGMKLWVCVLEHNNVLCHLRSPRQHYTPPSPHDESQEAGSGARITMYQLFRNTIF